MNKAIIVVDGGGTKTKVAVIDENKKIVYQKIGGCGSPAVLKNEALSNVFKIVSEVLDEIKEQYQITFIQMGISGLGVIANKTYFEELFTERLKVDVSLENDVHLALYDTSPNNSLVVIAGTGSACGSLVNDTVKIDGGWGHLLTEDGSGYKAVAMLMQDMINTYEETKTIAPFYQEFLKEIAIDDINKLRAFTYFNNKFKIAQYAQFIVKNAEHLEAQRILKQCGEDLARRLIRLSKNANFLETPQLGIYGGFISNSPLTQRAMLDYLTINNVKFTIAKSGEDPIYGGFVLARKKGKI